METDMRTTSYEILPKRLSYAVSLALASLVAGNLAMAQEAQQATASPTPPAASAPEASVSQGGQVAQVLVSTRRSQQSSIDRKKNAATAIDSIVAEDVGSLPDRNIGEAISRMAGIALDRGDFGDGVSVAVRGNGPDLTRVEIDGMAVQSAGGTDLNGGGSGRGTEFRQLSADLIKSVDVVKGSTADMTEGSLGGGIIVTTRTGLDFKEPFASVRVGATQNNLNKKWQPDTNVILSRKLFDNRVGLILNAGKSTVANEQHQQQVATTQAAGYARVLDFDNSPEKTFTFNPATVNTADSASNTPVYSAGGWNSPTPLQIVQRSADAKTKADCYTAFPQLTVNSPQLANLATGNVRNTAINTMQNAVNSCLNQWNDYTPSLIRSRITTQVEKRQNLDLRADFKVNNELTVYAKGSYTKYTADNKQTYFNLGNVAVNTANTFTDANGVRGLSPLGRNSSYYLYPSTASYVANTGLVQGATANVDPSSVVVDSSHHVTQMTLTNGSASLDQLHDVSNVVTKYFQTGGTWTRGGLKAEWLIGDAMSDFTREGKRTTFSQYYGTATMNVLPNGLWNYTFPANSTFDMRNPAAYVLLNGPVATGASTAGTTNGGSSIRSIPAYTALQSPQLTYAQPQLTYNPTARDTEERTAKLDLTYAVPDTIPFFTRFKTGVNLRDTFVNAYTGGAFIASTNPFVVVPQSGIRSFLVGCQDTAGSLAAGGNKCNYGYNPGNVYNTANSGNVVVTPQRLAEIIGQSLGGNATNTGFFSGTDVAPSGALVNWPTIDVDKVFALSGVPNMNMDCLHTCVGSDGKTYNAPVAKMKERSQAVYLMGDFNIDRIPFTSRSLPFGLELEGNLGYRYIKTKVNGTGTMTFTSITKNASYTQANPTAATGVDTSSVTINTAVNASTHDFLPIYNLAMWIVPDKLVLRYNRARTVARPPVGNLLAQGTCVYDERSDDDNVDQRCTSTIGNPALLAQKNLNQNWSAEFYPNKDTNVSLSYFKQKGLVGASMVQSGTGTLGLNVTDPVTGMSLGDIPYSYNTYMNGVPTTRSGWELNARTAFTFLPWFLKYTGVDANYTKLASVTSTQNFVDLLTGAPLPPLRESEFQYNWAVWYDDGRLQARIAVQGVAPFFNNIAGSSSNFLNNYPNASGNTRPPPYNPGSPNFRDATRYVDAKVSYKITPNIEVFLEGRNLTNATTSNSQGSFVPFSDGTQSILDYSYSGRRIMTGANFRFGG